MRGFGQAPDGHAEFTPVHRPKYEGAIAEFRARRGSPVARRGAPRQEPAAKDTTPDDSYPASWKRTAPGEAVAANSGATARDGVDNAYPAHWKR